MQIWSFSYPSRQLQLLVDHQPIPIDHYTGIFVASIPAMPFLSPHTFLLNCFSQCKKVCYAVSTMVSTSVSTPQLFCNLLSYPSVELVTLLQHGAVLRVNGPNCPNFLCLFDPEKNEVHPLISAFPSSLPALCSYEVFSSNTQGGCECILYYPTSVSAKLPLIVKLHGGPHNIFNASYNVETLCCLQHGFACCV